MAKFMNKSTMPIAVEAFTEQDLSCTHITTSNFMELGVAYYRELVPHQTLSVKQGTFGRMESMPVPTFGVASNHNKAFFVPYRTIMPSWNDFINDVAHTYDDGTVDVVSSVHSIRNETFVEYLMSAFCSEEVTFGDAHDFVHVSGSGTEHYYKFTPRGRLSFKILTQLGYAFSFNSLDADYRTPMSALGLLSLLKVYLDWYFPQAYAQSDLYYKLDKWLKYDSVTPMYSAFTYLDLIVMFDLISRVSYDSDYFVSAWDNPVSPSSGAYSSLSIKDPTVSDVQTVNNSSQSNGTPVASSGNAISQFLVNSLKSLSDYMRRHQIAGARALDRYLSRWGITLESAKLDRSQYLNGKNELVDFHDVTSTADTAGANLGDYAGKGVSLNHSDFEIKTDEYGMLLILSTYIPRTSYYQGRDRIHSHLTKTDFYTPEFDNLGVQALATSELYMPMNGLQQYPNGIFDRTVNIESTQEVFGFTPRYAEYKVGRDILSGDHRLGSLNVGKDAWNLYRNVDSYFEAQGMQTKHDVDFVLGTDAQQYDRIFYNTDDTSDKITVIHTFEVKSRFPGKSLFDSYEFESEGSQTVSVDAGGVKAN